MSLEVRLALELGTFRLDGSFDTGSGITALFGPSGAGKTLTLRCIAGLVRPSTGRIALGGRILLDTAAGIDLPPRDRGIGYVFQQYALFPHLTVEQNVAFGMRRVGRKERAVRTSALLDLMGLDGLHKRRPGELSGGQQQRVALARALAPEPRLLLLDEPFAAVDFRLRRRLRAELQRIHEVTRTPMLLVTHDLAEVRHLSDSLVLIEHGAVLRSGPTEALLSAPLDPLLVELLDAGSGI